MNANSGNAEHCPGCGPGTRLDDASSGHRYVGASPSCWLRFTRLVNAGEPPVAKSDLGEVLSDAYMVQHPGVPTPQSIQSVGLHGVVLYAVLEEGLPASQALWVRRRMGREELDIPRHERFVWLDPPVPEAPLRIEDVVAAATAEERAERVDEYVHAVWTTWSSVHGAAFAEWFRCYVQHDP